MSVTMSYKKFGLIPIATTWFNDNRAFIPVPDSLVHTLRQSAALSNVNNKVCLSESTFTTSIIDLTQSEEQIWKAMDPKSCRYEIRKIRKMLDKGEDVRIAENADVEGYIRVANNYIRTKGYTKPLNGKLLRRCIERRWMRLCSLRPDRSVAGPWDWPRDFWKKTGLPPSP